jgi:cytochrome o ubiquinol oxidase subunit I
MNLLGRLNWSAIPFNQPIIMGTAAFMILSILFILALITIKGFWPYLWREWLISVDHKRIGVMYCVLALIMLLRGFADAIMMRAQQAVAAGGAHGYLPPEHFDQIFSAHGTIMIFFMAMPFMIGLMNFVVPLQLGIRDVAFPTLNSVSLWLTASGILLVNVSLVVGEFAKTGWVAYPPLSELQFSPGVGVDYYLWALQISGIGTLMTGINFVTTILKMRAPGMGYMRMPVYCWTALATNLLIVAAFPVLTATFAMLLLDRYLGFHFFTVAGQGNSMMYVNLFWVWGHPEVYILVLPAFGVFSEVISTFSGKPLFGYRSMVAATMAICVLSFLVWLHHFFTMGASADVNGFFGVMTMIIAVPTGVKIFNWLFTMYGGRVRFTVPVLWSLGFMVTFVIGGMTGVLMAVPPADFQVHNSLFLVAHFHNVIIGGVLFGAMAGYNYWFPKAFGFQLDERWGRASFWCWLIGFYVAFMPLYVLGLMGMTRRMQHYDDLSWQPWLLVAAAGVVVILAGIVCQIVQLVVSIRTREKHRDVTGDPWNGRTLEWSTASPPPAWNFAVLPHVAERDAYWRMKQSTRAKPNEPEQVKYESIEMPRNSATGFVNAFFAVITGFALIWHIWWMASLGIFGAFVTVLVFTFRETEEIEVPAEQLAQFDRNRTRQAEVTL